MSSSQLKKSRRSMLLLIAVFALPVILAKFALEQQWFNYGVTNKGELLEQNLTLNALGLEQSSFSKHWLMLYTLPAQCDEQCEKVLISLNNTFVALGKDMPRVTPVALTQAELSEQQIAKIRSAKWRIESMPSQTKSLVNDTQVLIVDPLGNVILSHKTPVDAQELPQFGKNILADMKKLLKYSRIG